MNSRKGQAMIVTVLALSGMMLGATTIAGLLLTYQIRQTTDLAASTRAVYAADAGLEWALYRFFVDSTVPVPTFTNGVTLNVTCLNQAGAPVTCGDENTYTIRSKGAYGTVSRAFELTLQL